MISEVRGEGLLIGLKCEVPNSEVIDAFRAEKLLAVGAGDNVARLVPPLIVTEAEVADAIARVDRACTAIERAREGAQSRERPGEHQRHPPLPRSDRHSAQTTARDDREKPRHEEGTARRRRQRSAGRQDHCHDLRQAFDADAGVVRCRHPAARRRVDHADGPGDAARPRRDHRRYRARAVALRRRHHDPDARSRSGAGTGRTRHRSGDQRPDQAVASLPGDGRRA